MATPLFSPHKIVKVNNGFNCNIFLCGNNALKYDYSLIHGLLCIWTSIQRIKNMFILFLILSWIYSPMWAFAFLMHLIQSSLFSTSVPISDLALSYITIHTVPPSGFWSTFWPTSLGLISKNMTHHSFIVHSINTTKPIYSYKWDFIKITKNMFNYIKSYYTSN
jgi:hypothetical protein